MSRPAKNTVDYFPHFVLDCKLKYLLVNRWGCKGYAFWYQLMELLCESENHYFVCQKEMDFECLAEKTGIEAATVTEMLNRLAQSGKIDENLWENGIIWCEELVESLTPVYTKRKTEKPKKPILNRQKTVIEPEKAVIEPETEVCGDIYPQSKVKENKVKQSIEKNTTKSPSTAGVEEVCVKNGFEIFWEKYPKKADKFKAERYFKHINPDQSTLDCILAAIKKAKDNGRFDNLQYVKNPYNWLKDRCWEENNYEPFSSSECSFDADEFFETALRRGRERMEIKKR